jgi:hypothetical protein
LGALKMTVVREVILPKWFRHHLLTCTKRCGRMDYAERLFDRITSKKRCGLECNDRWLEKYASYIQIVLEIFLGC